VASNATALSAFHVSTAPNTGFNNNQWAERSGNKKKMVPLDGNSLNTLFDELSSWEDILKDTSINDLGNEPEP